MSLATLPMDLLRSFVTVADLGGYTRAAEVLHRTQPAISLQMKRLEELVDAKLIRQTGKNLTLTEDGQVLLTYARQILHMNDEAISYFLRNELQGTLKIGLPTDFSLPLLQQVVLDFVRDNPTLDIEINCDLSSSLMEKLHSDDISLTVALISEDELQYLVKAWEEQPIWVCHKEAIIDQEKPMALVGHPEGCEYRKRMIKALNGKNISWRIAYTSPDISGLQDAVNKRVGISALTQATLLKTMRVLDETDDFPALEKLKIGLFYKQPRLSEAGLQLSKHLIRALDKTTSQSPITSTHNRN